MTDPDRRRLLQLGLAAPAIGLLGACDRIAASAPARAVFDGATDLTYHAQRLIGGDALAPEYSRGAMSPIFRTNGNTLPNAPAWRAHAAQGFASWSLRLFGLVERPLAIPYAALLALSRRTQITRHDCVEGWSAIGEWSGPRVGPLLALARPLAAARFAVFRCFDDFGGRPYYESIDLADARHPQTILAVAMNGQPLSIPHGAPARLRVERQLGYKQAKFVDAIELVSDLGPVFGGKGGFWEDVAGYQWYAGI